MRKDEGLDRLAESVNAAQFVAFEPTSAGPMQTFFARVGRSSQQQLCASPADAIGRLLERSGEQSVNVRSYLPDDPQGKPFKRNLKSIDDALALVRQLTSDGLFTIVNESIDIGDGGVSGVIQGDVVEFGPDMTPRDVETHDVASLPRAIALPLLETVFGFRPDIDVPLDTRLEFSLHPKRRGWKHRHTIGWEIEDGVTPLHSANAVWPNDMSRMLGDKAFGLLMAHFLGLAVPQTTVIGRRVAPFTFGRPTGSDEIWTRTCPATQQPGRFTTVRGWADPFAMLADEDHGQEVASVLSQVAVEPLWSGASLVDADGELIIEGRRGDGAAFMMGEVSGESLPSFVRDDVARIHHDQAGFGSVRTEWVHDGTSAWVVQFHLGRAATTRLLVSEGAPDHWIDFDPAQGLAALRAMLAVIAPNTGINLLRRVGLTSHVADTIRNARVAARYK